MVAKQCDLSNSNKCICKTLSNNVPFFCQATIVVKILDYTTSSTMLKIVFDG